MRAITPLSGGRARGLAAFIAVLTTAALGAALPPAGTGTPPPQASAAGVLAGWLLGLLLASALQRAGDGPASPLASAGPPADELEEPDAVTPSLLADIIGGTPSPGRVGRIAIACLDDDAAAERWATAAGEALATRGVGVVVADLIPPGTARAGLTDVIEGDAELDDVLTDHPHLLLASIGPGADRDRALRRLDHALEDIPPEFAVVLVALRARDLRRRRVGKVLRSGWFDRVLVVAGPGFEHRSRRARHIAGTPVDVLETDRAVAPERTAIPEDPPSSGPAERPSPSRRSPPEDTPYRSTTVRVLPPGPADPPHEPHEPAPQTREQQTPDPAEAEPADGTPDRVARGGDNGHPEPPAPPSGAGRAESERYSPASYDPRPHHRGDVDAARLDEEPEVPVAPETAVATAPAAEKQDPQMLEDEVRPAGPASGEERTGLTSTGLTSPDAGHASTEVPSEEPPRDALHAVRPEDIWTRPEEARGEHDPRPHAKPLEVEPDLESRIWRDDERAEPNRRGREPR